MDLVIRVLKLGLCRWVHLNKEVVTPVWYDLVDDDPLIDLRRKRESIMRHDQLYNLKLFRKEFMDSIWYNYQFKSAKVVLFFGLVFYFFFHLLLSLLYILCNLLLSHYLCFFWIFFLSSLLLFHILWFCLLIQCLYILRIRPIY